MICVACRIGTHENCQGIMARDSEGRPGWCDCQHRPPVQPLPAGPKGGD